MQHLATGAVVAVTKLAACVMSTRRFTPPAPPAGAAGSHAQEALLAEEWSACCASLGVPSDVTAKWWGVIVQRYNEPQRAYHTVNHLYELYYQYYRVVGAYNFMFDLDMLEALGHAESRLRSAPLSNADSTAAAREASSSPAKAEEIATGPRVGQYLSSPFLSPPAVGLTIFFHDIIYDPKAGSGANEEASALLFEKFCRDCEVVTLSGRLALRESQLRARSLAIAQSEVLLEEAELLKSEKMAAETARRKLLEASGGGASGAPKQALEEEVALRARELRENAVFRRMDRPETLAIRAEAVYNTLQQSTPMPLAANGPSGGGAGRGTGVIPLAVEEEVMLLIRATKNHTATAATPQMETVCHPAMAAVEANKDWILLQRNAVGAQQLRRSLFPQQQSHCVDFHPTVETDLGLFLDMDLSIVGVADRSRYDGYGEQIRYEYQHFPSRDYRCGRSAILARFLAHAGGGGDAGEAQPLFKTPLYRFWCNSNARTNLAREIQSLAVPELKARTITIGDVPKVLAFYKANFTNAPPSSSCAAASEPLSPAALSFFRMTELEMEYLSAFNFEFCLMLRVEDEAEMMAFLAHERGGGGGGESSALDIATRVQEVSRASPPIVAAIFSSLTNDASVRGASQRTAQDFCGDRLIIHSIVVHAYYRRRGVGSKLVRELLNKARTASTSPPTNASALCTEPPTLPATAAGEAGVGGVPPDTQQPVVAPPPPALLSFFEKNGFARVGSPQVVQTTAGLGGGGAARASGLSLIEVSASLLQ